MSDVEEVEGGYRFLSVVLFLLISMPLAIYAIMPNNQYAKYLSFPARILLVPIHELGHTIVIIFTEALGLPFSYMNIPITMAGSVFEAFVPFVFVLFFVLGSRRYVLACLILVVLGTALSDWGAYVKSASNPSGSGFNQYMETSEITTQNHDWYIVLSNYNALDKADVIGDILMELGFVVTMMGFFSSVFEVNFILNNRQSSDFMLLMLYGSIPAVILSLAYFTVFRAVFAILLLIPILIHFYRRVLPKLEEEVKEVDKEIEQDDEEAAKSQEAAHDEEKSQTT